MLHGQGQCQSWVFASFMQQKAGAALLAADDFLSHGRFAAGCLYFAQSLEILLTDAVVCFFFFFPAQDWGQLSFYISKVYSYMHACKTQCWLLKPAGFGSSPPLIKFLSS